MSEPGKDSNASDLIIIGRITRTQGHRGAVRLFPEFEPVTRIEDLKTERLILEQPAGSAGGRFRNLHIEHFTYHQRFVIIHFAEITDMTGAEALRGCLVYVHENELWDLNEGEFLPHEVEGYQIIDQATRLEVGVVAGIVFGSAHDFFKVKRGEKTFLIPMVKQYIISIDNETKTVIVSVPPGLDEI